MKQYSYKFKSKLVKKYQRGEGSAEDLAQKYSMPTASLVTRWIQQVQNGGLKALRSGKGARYSVDYKLEVVDYCLKNDTSLNATALHFGIDNSTVVNWVEQYREHGIAGFCLHKQRRQSDMKKQIRPTTENSRQLQEIQKLKDELNEVKMERDVLKKLIAVTHKQPPMQKKHR